MKVKTFWIAIGLIIYPIFPSYSIENKTLSDINIKNICLIYYGSDTRRDWQPEDFEPYLAYTDTQTGKILPLFDTFLLIEFRSSDGKYFWAAQKEQDIATIDQWEWLAKRWTSCLDVIDECASKMKKGKKIQNNVNIIITIPEPDPNSSHFGKLPGSNVPLNFHNKEDRQKAVQWYINEVIHQIQIKQYKHLDFIGFYFLAESIRTDMENLVRTTADIIHDRNLKFFWIPYFTANNVGQWKNLGFDYMFLQPNYFFEGKGGQWRLPLAGYRIQQFQCGVEIELDDRILTSEPHQLRFQQYLQAGIYFHWNENPTAWYQENDTIYKLATSPDRKLNTIYHDIVHFINGYYQPPAHLPPITKYQIPDRTGTNHAHRNKGTKVIKPDTGFCTSLNPEWAIDGDITNYSGTQGFACCEIPGEIILQFAEKRIIHRIQLLLFNLDERYYQYRIDLSEDGQNWKTVIDNTQGEHRNWQTHTIQPHSASYLRIVPTYNSAHQSLLQIVEIEVY